MNGTIKIKGMRDISRALDRLPKELIRSSENAVLRAGAKPIEKAAKSRVVEDTGLLKKSIGIRVKKVAGINSARIGPRTGFKKSLGTRIARKTKGKRIKGQPYEASQDPNKYSHLVELGSSRVAPRPFIRPAIDAAQGQVVDAMANGLDKHLTRTVARLRKKAAQ